MSEDAGFFRNLGGLATDWVKTKRKNLQERRPVTNVDSAGGRSTRGFESQAFDHSDLREVKAIRESGGQIAQLMEAKALLNFGEGAELHVEGDDETEEVVNGEPMTLSEWLDEQFADLDQLVLELGADALWFPYAAGELRENRAGGFGDFLPAEPWTLVPETNSQGEIIAWHEETKSEEGVTERVLAPEDITHLIVNKASARDQTGISEILRNREELEAFRENEDAIRNAIELHGFPQRHIKVGREDGAPVRDTELRRVRNIFDPRTTDANTAYFTGQDVDVESLEAEQFEFEAIHEMDMRNLTTTLGLPLEIANIGSDGLGSGKPAELRLTMLKLSIKANQRTFGTQFCEKNIKPVIDEFSPWTADQRITLEINDPLEDTLEVADLINKVGEYMTNDEARSRLGLPEPEDEEIGDSYRTPADVEAPEDEGGGPFGGGGGEGLFRAARGGYNDHKHSRHLQDSFDDYPEAAQENARMALEARDETGNPNDCGQREGWARANQLAGGEPLSRDTVGRMAAFERHEDNKDQGEEGRADCGWMMWKAWGGDEGIEWAQAKLDELEREAGRALEVPDNAVPIDDESEAPDDAQIVRGDRGGLYYVPSGGGGRGDTDERAEVNDILDSDQADWKKRDELQDLVTETTPLASVRFDDFEPEQAAAAADALLALDQTDQLENLSGVSSGLTEQQNENHPNALAVYDPNRRAINLDSEMFTEDMAQELNDDNWLAGDDRNHAIAHEVGHHQHFEVHRDGDVDIGEIREQSFTAQEQSAIEEELSQYAATNPLEFVAEAYGVKADGDELSDRMEELYTDFRGVDPV